MRNTLLTAHTDNKSPNSSSLRSLPARLTLAYHSKVAIAKFRRKARLALLLKNAESPLCKCGTGFRGLHGCVNATERRKLSAC